MTVMKTALRIVTSLLVALILLVIGGSVRRPYPCFDCFEPHGFPFTYRQDGGFAGGAAFYPLGMIGDLLVLALLTATIAWGWKQIGARRKKQT